VAVADLELLVADLDPPVPDLDLPVGAGADGSICLWLRGR
jgi:hypothetical protein